MVPGDGVIQAGFRSCNWPDSTRMVPGEGVIQAGVALTKASGLSLARLVPGEGFIHTDRFMVTWHAVAQHAGGKNLRLSYVAKRYTDEPTCVNLLLKQ